MDSLKYTEILQKNKQLSTAAFDKILSVKILSNVTVNAFKEIFEYSLRLKKISPQIEIGNFDNLVQDSHHVKDENIIFIFYDMLNIADSVSDYFELLDHQMVSELEAKIKNEIHLILENLKDTPSVIFNSFSTSAFNTSFTRVSQLEKFVRDLNEFLYSLNYKNLVIVNIDKIVFELGRDQAYDFRFYLSSKAPYSLHFFKSYIKAIEPTIKKITGAVKKAIIFDCDNTLWKGVLGEDGFDNIQMTSTSSYGKPFNEVQHIARYLSRNGILVGLCSKNNAQDVDHVFANHKDIVLTNQDIVIKEVNWNDKVSNLLAISKKLNIGIDSIVFVDDSDYEINLVKEALPDVETLQVPKNLYQYKNNLLAFIYKNFNFSITEEDLQKTEQYKTQVYRDMEKNKFESLEKYIAALKIRLDFYKDSREQIVRISQLTQKTNQFNLTTVRYSETEIQKFIEDENCTIYTGSISDKYGDSGITILSIVCKDSFGQTARIDTLLMSCRIIGRNIEIVFLNSILNSLKESGIKSVTSSFISTTKNAQVSDFYEKLGFELTETSSGIKRYELNLHNYKSSDINYIEINYL